MADLHIIGYYTKIASIIEAKTPYTGLLSSGNFTHYAGCMACIDTKNAEIPHIFIINDARQSAYISQNRQIT
jgi:hypothetical protein